MSQIVKKVIKGQPYYYEVENYRENGKVKHRNKYLGKDFPEDTRYRKGYNGDPIVEGKRIQVYRVNFGMEDFLEKQGTIKEYRMKKGKEYALVVFDEPVRKRNDWLLPFDMLGNIKRGKTNGN